jgi:hypothetical protein
VIVDVPAGLGVAQQELLSTCRVLKNQVSLSWLLALQPPHERKADWLRVSRGYFYPLVKLPAFTEPEIDDFLRSYPKAAEDPELLDWLLQLFGGQPFLTHVAIEMIEHGKTRESVEHLALHRSDSFGFHLMRMEEAMGTTLAAALRHLDLDSPSSGDDRAFLSEIGVVKPEGGSAESTGSAWGSRFYESSFGPELQMP